jgi:CRISPR system Cascade subunit CasD
MPPSEYLCFRLWGPMSSWGDITVGEQRSSWSRPSRSGVLGLIAAALGIERSNGEAHGQLEKGLGLALRVARLGIPLRDYHTAQSPTSFKNSRWATRRDELSEASNLNTILSERSYLTDLDATILLWRRQGSDVPSLLEIKRSLEEPRFVLYLGRKSCPLGLPIKAHFLDAASPLDALAAYDAAAVMEFKLPRRSSRTQDGGPTELWLDEQDALDLNLPITERTVRRDRVRDRLRWHFSDRNEVLIATGEQSR